MRKDRFIFAHRNGFAEDHPAYAEGQEIFKETVNTNRITPLMREGLSFL